ncbi:hypothetical protein OR16_32089 [Cupriavidus basilensis OR16]|uniref:Uncharacterized protein n=1 Tax=Cupriavidus basilensis OR16 TaxID=1127483 RepID=H1SDT2_9BURK|nr:S41 family peptidase [Cupriavidus basilensis]EHP39359.1 hypothetical protein OR16_32089 [Cupriavidus basilensis OR16]
MSSNWSTVAAHDIARAHEIVTEAHPGVLDPTDRVFQQWFTQGYQEAMELARHADSEGKALAALRFYTAGYRDGHLGVWQEGQASALPLWAGWTVQRRDGKYRVVARATDWPIEVPEIGDELVACDGRSVEDLLASKVAPFVDRRVNLEASLSRLSLHLTNEWSQEMLWEPLRLKHCEFRSAAKDVLRFELSWQASAEGFRSLTRVTPRQGIKQLQPGIYWIHASNFMLDGEDLLSFEMLLNAVRDLGDAEAVVLDARGNNGGNSMVGNRLLAALLKDAMPTSSTAKAYWRVSSVARVALEAHKAAVSQVEGPDSRTYKFMDALLSNMNAAAARHQTLVQQVSVPDDEPPEGGRPFSGKLVLVTDSYCASACLDFADSVLSIPGTVQAGSVTSADTRYMDISQVSLPSGVNMWLPLKVWKNRKRRDNEPHVPKFTFEGDLNDTVAVQAWVIDRVLPSITKISTK